MSKAEDLEKIEEQTFQEDDNPEMPPPDVIAYNELRSCADLYRMFVDGILEIQPHYQSEVVWKNPSQTRFIDSLIKHLPIPSMCFSYDYNQQKWQVIDGLQRMTSIIKFLSGSDGKLSKLEDIDPAISGQSVKKFQDKTSDLYKYYQRVENLTLPINVLRCDLTKDSHTNYIFTIFHRLNSGGAKLNNQEIRNCIFSGNFNELLHKLNENKEWMSINKMKDTRGYRFVKQELILRMFAFSENLEAYDGHLARFLNDFMKDNRNLSESLLLKKENGFNETVRIIYTEIFNGKIPANLSLTVLEAILVGVFSNLNSLKKQTDKEIKSYYQGLINSDEFSSENLLEGLAGKDKVIKRLNKAKEIFDGN